MKRVVVDTNVFISAMGWGGTPLKVLRLWRNDAFVLVTSLDILDEIEKVVVELGFSQEIWQDWKAFLFEKSSIIEIKKNRNLKIMIRDPHDAKFIECALWGGASVIVSGDKDLLSLKRYMGIDILSPSTFIKEI